MQTKYRLTVVAMAHESIGPAAVELAKVFNEGPGGGDTFDRFVWEDADGEKYALASFPAEVTFVTATSRPLVAPPWNPDVDLDLAAQAQAAILPYDVSSGGEPVQVAPGKMVVYFGPAGANVLDYAAMMGVTKLPESAA